MTTPIERAVQQAVAGALPVGRDVVLAVSGGVDSMVLLDAAAASRPPDRLRVATFDHRTGAGAARACALVQRRAEQLGVRCDVGRAAATLAATEEAWRVARWSFLRSVAGDGVVATGHTADDHVETILLRVLRGAGARGLAALLAGDRIVRPLLGVTRARVLAYAAARRLEWRDDPTNDSPAFKRNRVRHELLPALRAVRPHLDDELLDLGARAAAWRADVEQAVGQGIGIEVMPRGAGLDVSTDDLAGLGEPALAIAWPVVMARMGVPLDRRGLARLVGFTPSSRVRGCVQVSGGITVTRARDRFEVRRQRQDGRPAHSV